MVVRPSCNWAHGRTGWDRVELQRWNLSQPELGVSFSSNVGPTIRRSPEG